MRYQETWIGGPTGEPFQRECASRYAPIHAELERYSRPFTVFDFGANLGYFSFRIASDFPHATVVAVDNRAELPKLAKANGLQNVVVLSRRMTGADLAKLAQCEVFDVVLALNVLHHMPDWRVALDAFKDMARAIIVETPGPGDKGALERGNHKDIQDAVKSGIEVRRTGSHVTAGAERIMYRVDGTDRKTIAMQTVDAPERGAPEVRAQVTLSDSEARIWFARGEERPFVPGINLWNAVKLGMAWPTDAQERVRTEVSRLGNGGRWHDDLRPWNFVLAGNRAVAIDIGNKHWRKEPEPGGLDKCLQLMG
ncbi:class I SAM-dependent methyltransferase [Methyloceanibacter caenitepidi]|uniref:Phage protein n=1 Tax=Methyloceanibacter caenitepidi TaxID=1384459 RepID=A0A0A8K5U9_9HYPH|nr:class I SAM-dependent methyltransferase [Methyloceanibacter caenitepidi]BAQ18323.1 phage protein [Methyloceanibacter caenitepidi]